MQQPNYHPKENHPWRQYRNKKKAQDDEESDTPSMSLKQFLTNIVENWESYKIPPANFEDRDYISLCKINPDKQAEWLISFLKKHWLGTGKGIVILE